MLQMALLLMKVFNVIAASWPSVWNWYYC